MRKSATLLGLLLVASASAFAGDESSTESRVDEVFAEYDGTESPGCALGVFRDGRIVYARGYGTANLEHALANSTQTVFDIGSTSKQFTAMAILLLERDGKLRIED
jgi:CubicO group peptidase (beta-lactamase class C family)